MVSNKGCASLGFSRMTTNTNVTPERRHLLHISEFLGNNVTPCYTVLHSIYFSNIIKASLVHGFSGLNFAESFSNRNTSSKRDAKNTSKFREMEDHKPSAQIQLAGL